MYQSIPKPPIPPRAIPGHLTRVKLRTVGNLTQNEARPVGHLTFVSKRLSAVGNKRISQFFDSARAPRSRVIALVDSTWVFLLLSFYIVLSWNMPLFKVWSEDKLNKKFVVAENFAELVFKGKRFFLYSFISWVHGVTEAACHWRVISQINIHIFKASVFFGDRLCLHILFVEWVFFLPANAVCLKNKYRRGGITCSRMH